MFALQVGLLVPAHATAEHLPPPSLHWVHGTNLSAAISTSGHLVHLNTSSGWAREAFGRSWLTDGFFNVNAVSTTPFAGGVTVTRSVTVQGYGSAPLQTFSATITDRFSPCPDRAVGGLVWNSTIQTTSTTPWRAVIATELLLSPDPGTPPLDFWLPFNGDSLADDVLAMRNGSSASFTRVALGTGYNYGIPTKGHMPFPLFLWAGGLAARSDGGGGGLMVAPRLNDTTLAATADLNSSALVYRRHFNRLSFARARTFVTHLGALPTPDPAAIGPQFPAKDRGDDPWREALRFTLAVNPNVFHAVQPPASSSGQPTSLARVGLGMYTCSPANSLNVSTTVDSAGGTTLWDASFWWPYIGQFLPPVSNASEQWTSNLGASEQAVCSGLPGGFRHGQRVSARTIAEHLVGMREIGVSVPLSYFNLFEVGQNVRWPLPAPVPRCQPGGAGTTQARCWNDSSIFISSALSDAVLFQSPDRKQPFYTWQKAIVLDPGVPSYRDFLVAQAQRHFDLLGSAFRGIVIDRTDHTAKASWGRDDGELWCGAPCASMLLAWLEASKEVSAIIHGEPRRGGAQATPGEEPLMLINFDGSARADLLRHADGIFSESGDVLLNSLGLSTVAMPAVGWTYQGSRGPGSMQLNHAYLQHHLRMGVHPMAPVHGADHSLDDRSAAVDALFKDYGPLFRRLRATRWGLDRSHVVRVHPPPSEGGPLHNVFASMTPRSSPTPWVVVLALAAEAVDSVLVTLKLPFGGRPAGCEVMLPGVEQVETAEVVRVRRRGVGTEELLQLEARLMFGCALLECSVE